jgi:hypothetical protein
MRGVDEDDLEFVGSERRGGATCAVFRGCGHWDGDDKLKAFNRSSLEMRLRNLQAGGHPYDDTYVALVGWPDEVAAPA